MNRWFRRIRGAVGMGLVWGLVWAIVGGGIMEAFVDPNGRILGMWPQVFGIAGFLRGVAGVAVGAFLMTTGTPLLIMAPAALLCAGSASGSLALARRVKGLEAIAAGADVADKRLNQDL